MESGIHRSLDTDGAAVVTVEGEIDFSNADELAGCVRDAVAEWSPPIVRVDLRSATFIDSTGLGALIEGYRATTDIESRFCVVNPSPAFRRVLDVTGLCDFFGLGETVEPAGQTQATGA
ncbi:STAS domain-containing protein [Actinoplanes bogorensis]|uniref:Anti-sigma factor antagonist n=1 Tax=Paractinoplanes bogorensis TaxID=1610840 RepID=A0ABS5YW56_9ACTN|nr:STAS domain-containing protein [Actinoplanes bogorensis]MBU2667677.1 STAS domain-containing protein [Actinoplanes bogorensis]